MLLLRIDVVKDRIKTIGLYNSKAESMMKTYTILRHEYGRKIPRTRDALEVSPGISRKTANLILNTAFGEPTVSVDAHIFQLTNKIRIAPENVSEQSKIAL